mgnify:CR=1 FL=1
MHPHCLHIWKPVFNDNFINEQESNENFPIPPHILVGFRDDDERAAFLELADKFGLKINNFK